MADRVVDYALKSLAYFVDQNIADFTGAYVITPDFDYDKKPDPSKPGDVVIQRQLPYAGIELASDEGPAFSIGNILIDQQVDVLLLIFGRSYTETVRLTADTKQSLRTSINPITQSPGITLFNFAIVSGSFYANAGTMQIDVGRSHYFGPADKDEEENRKHRSVTLLNMSAFKDNTATLLENMGRVDLTDS